MFFDSSGIHYVKQAFHYRAHFTILESCLTGGHEHTQYYQYEQIENVEGMTISCVVEFFSKTGNERGIPIIVESQH